ncbi:hypothetical protein Leryth_026024 [Lithospermum erythrorhizon]|nr:hypothetical protein Leryth_026024 [Lithospermum erythrorhizon]
MALQWLSLIATIWLQCINGTNTNFPCYSSKLKQILNLSQLQVNNLAFASDAGKLFGWVSGVAAAYLPLWIVLIIGSSLGLFGYGAQYLFVVSNQTTSMSYIHVFLLTALAGNSICWINTVCYIVLIKKFPLDRQLAIGISTSYVGLSAKIFNDIVNVVVMMNNFSTEYETAQTYLLLNAILPLIVCVMVSPFVNDFNFAKSRKIGDGFFVLVILTITTGIFAMVTSLNITHVLSSRVKLSTFVGIIFMGVFLIMPLVVPLVEKVRETIEKKCFIRVDNKGHAVSLEKEIEWQNEVKREKGEYGRQMVFDGVVGVKIMLQKGDFWLYFCSYFFGATIGLVYMNNLGQIVESRGSLSATSSLVSISSVFSFFGRLIPSFLDYYNFRKNYRISRPASIASMVALMAGAFFLLVEESNISLLIGTATIGLCTGAITSISVSTTTELFGTKNFGINHNILVANIPIGSFLYGNLAAKLYKRAGTENGNCVGAKCYETTFIMWGCFCCLGTLMAFILHRRNKTFIHM